jgi:hypothetical protein
MTRINRRPSTLCKDSSPIIQINREVQLTDARSGPLLTLLYSARVNKAFSITDFKNMADENIGPKWLGSKHAQYCG